MTAFTILLICRGQSPAQADMNLLETARRCESYGIMHIFIKNIVKQINHYHNCITPLLLHFYQA